MKKLMDRASTSICTRGEGRFRLSASYFPLLRQRKVTKGKATPTGPVVLRTTALRCSTCRAAAKLGRYAPSDTRGGTAPTRLRFSADPKGERRRHGDFDLDAANSEVKRLTAERGQGVSPSVTPRSADAAGAFRRGCLSERSERVPRRPVAASIAGQSRSDRHRRGRLLLVTFLGEARKVTRQRRNRSHDVRQE